MPPFQASYIQCCYFAKAHVNSQEFFFCLCLQFFPKDSSSLSLQTPRLNNLHSLVWFASLFLPALQLGNRKIGFWSQKYIPSLSNRLEREVPKDNCNLTGFVIFTVKNFTFEIARESSASFKITWPLIALAALHCRSLVFVVTQGSCCFTKWLYLAWKLGIKK